MELFLLDNYRSQSRSRSRKHNFFSALASAPAKNYGSGQLRLQLRNTVLKYSYQKNVIILFGNGEMAEPKL